MNLIQPVSVSNPYCVPLKFSIPNEGDGNCEYVVDAIVDPGSPVSLVKSEYILTSLRELVPPNGDCFSGVNKSPVRVLGTFSKLVEVEGINIRLRFLVVPNETMSCVALLGCDFCRDPLIKVELGETIKITKRCELVDENDTSTQIMQINYLENPVRIREELNINPYVEPCVAESVRKLYDEEH